MSNINLWRLAEELNVIQASLLLLGLDAEEYENDSEDGTNRPNGYIAISTSLKNAVKSGSLKVWLQVRQFTNNFFFDDEKTLEDYLDPFNKFYAAKLAAAVSAWKAISSDQSLLNGNMPKQAIDRWLRENANKYGLTKDDGNPNESAIQEISKIANWNTLGGVAKTPTQVQKNLSTSTH